MASLDIILRAVFGVEDAADLQALGDALRVLLDRGASSVGSVLNMIPALQRDLGPLTPWAAFQRARREADELLYAQIARRRAVPRKSGADVLSMLLEARDEEGQLLTDQELRDELMGLILAGHETTANSLAWAFERLLRTPDAYDRLRDEVRSGDDAASAAYVEATIHETMRSRPVIPMVVRTVKRRWRLGEYVIGVGTPVAVSIIGLHHRDDVYPRPQEYRPERFLNRKPGTYTWIPFGGGIRRCLGATLAMAEQRVVLAAIARRTDLAAADPAPEAPRMRNVTMIPGHGGRIVVTDRRSS